MVHIFNFLNLLLNIAGMVCLFIGYPIVAYVSAGIDIAYKLYGMFTGQLHPSSPFMFIFEVVFLLVCVFVWDMNFWNVISFIIIAKMLFVSLLSLPMYVSFLSLWLKNKND